MTEEEIAIAAGRILAVLDDTQEYGDRERIMGQVFEVHCSHCWEGGPSCSCWNDE